MNPSRTSRFSQRCTAIGLAVCSVVAAGQFWSAAASAEEAGIADTDPHIERAWSWVQSMLRTPTRVESTTTLNPQQEYPVDWTGQVTGTFTVSGVTAPPIVPAAVALDPGSATNAHLPAYRGVLTGRITLAPQQNRWIVQAYRERSGRRFQVPAQSLVRPDGTFAIDVSATEPGPGNWQFGVLDAGSGYAPVGEPWPSSGTYSGWQIRSFATTDRRYLIGTEPASVDGSFNFDSTAPGTKTFQLVAVDPAGNPAGDRVLAEHAPPTGLVRSFAAAAAPGEDDHNARSYAYDQALALQAALVMDSPVATPLVRGLMALQTRTGPQAGGFITSAPQSNPAGGEPVYFTGNTAVALYALLSYLRSPGGTGPERSDVQHASELAVDWLLRQQLDTGPMAHLLTGGWKQPGSSEADPSGRLPYASTEHNVDAWQALSLAGRVLPCERCTAAAASLQQAIVTVLWDDTAGGFTQGMRPEGRDTVDPLDVHSWGSIFLNAIGRSDMATASIESTVPFRVSDLQIPGYLAYRAQPTMPHPVRSVWVEGSLGVALALARHGDEQAHLSTLAALRAVQRPDGSLPVATSADSDRGFTTDSAVAPTTWFILASKPDHPLSLWSAHGAT